MIPLYDDRADYRSPRRFPIMTVLLIVANVLVFAGWQLRLGLDESVRQAGFLPHEFTKNPLSIWCWRYVFTSMFMHGGWAHLLGNMWFLWIFGDDIEEHCGAIGYLFLYLLTGIAAVLAFTLVDPQGEVPLVGASGAISGVLGAYFLHREHLVELADYPSVVVQVMPFRFGAHAGESGAFSVLRFPEQDLPDVVYVEQLTSALYLDKRDDVDEYLQVMERLCVDSLTPQQTLDLLHSILKSQ